MIRLVCAAFALLLGGAPTAAQEALLGIYGAWVLEGEECTRIFANDNGRVVFAAQARGAAARLHHQPDRHLEQRVPV
jgi:hypothetical protein